ncbi:MAG: hypothetical protein ACRCYX_11530 [Dermatophilaceae bacterium]
MSQRIRRAATLLTAAASCAAVLTATGCGTVRTDQAAVVDGTVISETDVQQATSDINGMEPALVEGELAPSNTLTALIQAPVVLDNLAGRGVVVSESVARADAAERGVEEPSAATVEILRLNRAIGQARQSGALDEALGQQIGDELSALTVEVNPRYGAYDRSNVSVQPGAPGWISLSPTASPSLEAPPAPEPPPAP